MFIPNRTAQLYYLGATDIYGDRKYKLPITVSCSVVHLNKKALKTTVRADSSASRGSADEFVSVSKILFPIYVRIGIDDKLVISGFILKAMTIEPRYAVNGNLDHNEVDFEQQVDRGS